MKKSAAFFVLLAITILLAISPATADDDPFALINDYIVCSKPDVHYRTCSGMSDFKRISENSYLLNETFVLERPPFYRVSVTSRAYAKDGMICVTSNSMSSIKLTMDGEPIDAELEATQVNQFLKAMSQSGIVEICAKYTKIDVCGHKLLRVETFFDGVARPPDKEPGANYSVWVGRNNGFRIRKGGATMLPPENSCQG
jgi:hypothetical protein